MDIFHSLESKVQCYARSFPGLFQRAKGSYLYDSSGKPYLDFLAGAGALNYGHNHPELKHALLDYLNQDGITHGLDLHTTAKEAFLINFEDCLICT